MRAYPIWARRFCLNDLPIVFREDGCINMTKAAQAFGKDVRKFFKTDETTHYMKALYKMGHIEPNIQKQATRGRNGATFGHPKLAVFFSRWLSPEFNVWCDLMIDNILKGNIQTTVVVPTVEAVDCPGTYAHLQAIQKCINHLILFIFITVHSAINQVQWRPSLTDRHPQGRPTMLLFNYEVTLCRDYVTRAPSRPWFSIEPQEHYSGEWEILIGSLLLLVTKQDTHCTA